MSYMLELLIALLIGGALGLWAGCRYGCEGIAAFLTRCRQFITDFFWVIVGIILVVIIIVVAIIAGIALIIWNCIKWLASLPWRRWWQSLRWLWWILGGLLFLIAALLAMLGFLPAAIGLALLALFLWLTLLGLLASIIVMILVMLAWFAGLFQDLAKGLAAFLAGLSLTIPTCSDAPSAPTPAPVAVAAPAPAPLPPTQEGTTCAIVPIEKGDGTIRATARGGHPLGLEESLEWTRNQGLLVRRVGRYIHAPTLYMSDHIEWCDGKGWILVRPSQRGPIHAERREGAASGSILTRNTSPKIPLRLTGQVGFSLYYLYILSILASMKLIGLSGYRGLAMLLIIVYHLNQIRPIQNLALWDWKLYQFFSLLPVIVSVFFILGGLLRSLSYWKVIFHSAEIPPFWKGFKDRFFRIAPLFYLALVLSFLWSVFIGVEDWKSFLVGFTFFSWLHPSTFFPVALNGPLWFVAYDMMGNLMVMIFMAKVIWLIRNIKIGKFWILTFSFLLGFIILLGLHKVFISLPFPKLEGIVSVWFPYYNPFIFGVYYLFGALLGGLYFFLRQKSIKEHLIADAVCIISLFGIGFFLYDILGASDLSYSYPISPFRFPLVPFLFGVSIFSLLFSKYVGKWIDNTVFLFIGKISYPLYLFHALVIAVLQSFFFGPAFSTFSQWFIFAGTSIVVSILISIIVFRFEERINKKISTK